VDIVRLSGLIAVIGTSTGIFVHYDGIIHKTETNTTAGMLEPA